MSKIVASFKDSNGKPLNIGDLLMVHSGNDTFYVEFGIVDGCLVPFDTFCWRNIEKVKEVPKKAERVMSDSGYEYWYVNKPSDKCNEEFYAAAKFSEVSGQSKYCVLKIEE